MSTRPTNPLVAAAIKAALRPSRSTTLVACSLAVANPFVASTSHAQQAGSQGVIEEVVVSARKREESLTEVPVSVSAVSADSIDAAGILTLTDLFDIVPGVENNADGSRAADKPAIRGVGSQENASIRAKVTSFIDGVPLIGAQGIGTFAGIDRVEILRGPQSAAFGRSTFGGAINYVTKSPTDEFSLSLRGTFGEEDTRNLSATLATPVIRDHLGLLVTLQEKNYGGESDWKTRSGQQIGDTNDKLGMIKLAFDVNEAISGSFLYLRQEVDDGHPPILFADLSQYVPHPDNPTGSCAINGGMGSCVILGEVKSDLVPVVFEYDFDNPANPIDDPGTRVDRDRFQGSIEVDFGNGYNLEFIGAYTEEDGFNWLDRDGFTFTGMQTIHAAATPEIEEKYGELRLTSPTEGPFDWLVGASLYEYDYVNTVYNNFTADIVMDIFAEKAENTGIFFNVGYDFNDRLTASLEGRYQIDKIKGEYPATPARNAPAPIGVEEETKTFQPRIALTYALNDDNNVYVQVARGTNPAGFNVNALDPILQMTAASEGFNLNAFVAFDEEEIWNYEVGLKGTILDDRLRYSVAAYYLQWDGYVQPATVNWTPDDGILLPGTVGTDYFSRMFLSIGDLDGAGFELEATWKPTDHISIDGMLSYSGLEFTDDACSPIPVDYGVPPIQTDPYACASVGGNAPPMFSRLTSALAATYTAPINESMDWYARLDYHYRSKRYVEQTNTDYIPGFHIVNLRGGLRGEHWLVELFVDNLTDDDTPTGAVRFFDGRQPGMVFGTTFVVRRPRWAGIRLAYDF